MMSDVQTHAAGESSRLLALPDELLAQIVETLLVVDRLCLKRTCTYFWHFCDGAPRDLTCGERHILARRLRKSRYPELVRQEQEDWYPSQLCCRFCYATHDEIHFSTAQQSLSPLKRLCKGAQARLRVCLHNTFGYDELQELLDTRAEANSRAAHLWECGRISDDGAGVRRRCPAFIRDNGNRMIRTETSTVIMDASGRPTAHDCQAALARMDFTASACPHLPTAGLEMQSRGFPTICCPASDCSAQATVMYGSALGDENDKMVLITSKILWLSREGSLPDPASASWYACCDLRNSENDPK